MPALSINAEGDSKLKLLATLFKRFWSINPGQLALCFLGRAEHPQQPLPQRLKSEERLVSVFVPLAALTAQEGTEVPQQPSCILGSTGQIKHLYNIQAGGRNVNSTLRKAIINM